MIIFNIQGNTILNILSILFWTLSLPSFLGISQQGRQLL